MHSHKKECCLAMHYALILCSLICLHSFFAAYLQIANLSSINDERILFHPDIGMDDAGALLCVTGLLDCCTASDTPMDIGPLGDWYTPSGDLVTAVPDLYGRNTGNQVVRLFRGNLSLSDISGDYGGIYRCEIPVQLNPTIVQTIYVGIYSQSNSSKFLHSSI